MATNSSDVLEREVRIAARAETILRLRHLGLPADQREPHGQGWDHYLARLVLVATGVDPGPDSLQDAPSQPEESRR